MLLEKCKNAVDKGKEMKGNGNKCHLIINKQGCMNLKIRNMNIENSNCEKRLGVKVIINSTSLNTWME